MSCREPAVEIRTHPTNAFSDRKSLLTRVIAAADVAAIPGVVLLDGGTYDDSAAYLDEFRDFAFYWNASSPKVRVPSHVLALMNDLQCVHLIWLSRKALEEPCPHLAWILAHEIGHLRQATTNGSLSNLRRKIEVLRRDSRFRNLPNSQMGVDDVDSDLFALGVTRELFGPAELQAYFARHKLARCPEPQYFPFMQELESRREQTTA